VPIDEQIFLLVGLNPYDCLRPRAQLAVLASGFIRTIRTFLGSLRFSLNSFFSSCCTRPTLGF
jgi:hypothetical protein